MAIEGMRSFSELLKEPLRNGLTRPKRVRGEGVKMVNMGELFAYSRIGNIPMERVPLSDVEAQNGLLQPGDLLFARQSIVLEGAGKCSIFLGASEPITYEGHLIRARINAEIGDPLFYYYFFNSPSGRTAITSIVEQVAAAGIRGSDLAKLGVIYPPLPEQHAIAHILGTLDDKIELNRCMNETLEAMARALFKAWFVDFEPVRAKAEGRDTGLPPYLAELFPSRLMDSRLDEVPEGWKIGTIGEVAENLRRGVAHNEIGLGTAYIGLEHMPRHSIALADWGYADGLESNKFEFKQGEILFGKLRPYFHKVGVAPVDGVCSTDILVIVPKEAAWFAFVLGHVSSDNFVNHTYAGSTGTKMPRTNWQDMARYEVAMPPRLIAESFTRQVRPSVERINVNVHASRTLAAVRDALLPKLISGEIRVKDAEKFITRIE